MKLTLLILFIPVVVVSQILTGVIKGSVIDTETKETLAGANIFLSGTNLGTAANVKGKFEINEVPFGKYIVTCSFIGYPVQKDTIELSPLNKTIVCDFKLQWLHIPIPIPDSLKAYHSQIESIKPEEILGIHLDSISGASGNIYMTIFNKTNMPLFLIKDLPCFNTISIVAKNSSGELLKSNTVDLGCDEIGTNYLPQPEDLIKLEPNSLVRLSSVESIGQYLPRNQLRHDTYSISVKYELKEYKYLPGVYTNLNIDYYESYKSEIEVLNQATRGIVISGNEIVITY